ncbi:MAG: hypothetical protein ATN36_01150 [Epulopiscium sp. Nele67-Bin005]|nr:MAG: hypothetical protein ATN36_01150 [Epulopiscium sp. Nele67-Bin005]
MRKKVFPLTIILLLTGCSEPIIKEETQTIIWLTEGITPPENELVINEISKYTIEKLGYPVEINYFAPNEYSEVVTKMIEDGKRYDIAFASPIKDAISLANQGYFADLSPYLSYSSLLKETIPSNLWKGVMMNNTIIGVPTIKNAGSTEQWVWSYKEELAEKFSFDNLKSLEDVDHLLYELKTEYPDQYILDFTYEGMYSMLVESANLERVTINSGINYADKTAKVENIWQNENIKSNLELINKWYNDKIINPNVFANNNSLVVLSQSILDDSSYLNKIYSNSVHSTNSVQSSYNVVSTSSPHIQKCVEFLELVNTDIYLRNLLAYGIEGIHYQKLDEDTIIKLNNYYEPQILAQGNISDLYFVVNQPTYIIKEETPTISPIIGFRFDNELVKNEILACQTIEKELAPLLLSGKQNPHDLLPQLSEMLYSEGYLNIKNALQSQIDEFLNT